MVAVNSILFPSEVFNLDAPKSGDVLHDFRASGYNLGVLSYFFSSPDVVSGLISLPEVNNEAPIFYIAPKSNPSVHGIDDLDISKFIEFASSSISGFTTFGTFYSMEYNGHLVRSKYSLDDYVCNCARPIVKTFTLYSDFLVDDNYVKKINYHNNYSEPVCDKIFFSASYRIVNTVESVMLGVCSDA